LFPQGIKPIAVVVVGYSIAARVGREKGGGEGERERGEPFFCCVFGISIDTVIWGFDDIKDGRGLV